MKLNVFICVCFFVENICVFFLTDFPFYVPILLMFWFRYLQTHIKESCMHLSSQFFFETAHKTLKFQEKLLPLHKNDVQTMLL